MWRSVVDMFHDQVDVRPDHLALVHRDERLTYAELNDRANRLAARLLSRGLHRGHRVAIALPRGAAFVVAILASLKVGAVYVPLDIEQPHVRLRAILRESCASLVLTDAVGKAPSWVCAEHHEVLRVQQQLTPVAAAPDVRSGANVSALTMAPISESDMAYIIFTSGSTGAPKGVMVSHRGMAALARDHVQRFALGPHDRILQFASFAFDCSVGDVVMSLTSGATHIVRPSDCISGEELGDLIDEEGVTQMTIPPQVLAALPLQPFSSLKRLVAAGEPLPRSLVRRWAPGRRMFNVYGPTESTVDSTVAEVFAEDQREPSIGVPIRGTDAHVLDEYLRPVEPGEIGELFLSGLGLAAGYVGQSAMTAERFLPSVFGPPGDRMYRTGDLVRRRVDGALEYVGRTDHQVKIRGFRVELGEIEASLDDDPSVDTACVLAEQDPFSQQQLIAYVSLRSNGDEDLASVLARLRGRLPDYMVPSRIVGVEKFPLTSNGKINRKALPKPTWSDRAADDGPVGPDPQQALLRATCSVLGLASIDPRKTFVGLGGDSVQAIRVVAMLRASGWVAASRDLLGASSLRDVGNLLRTATSISRDERTDVTPASEHVATEDLERFLEDL